MKLADTIQFYIENRRQEFLTNQKQHRRTLFGHTFGISYKDKINACLKIQKALRNEVVNFTKEDMDALRDGQLYQIMDRHRAEWPASFLHEFNLPLVTAIQEYMRMRTEEFERTQQEYINLFYGIGFGIPYTEKMHACQQLLKALAGEPIELTESDVAALGNGTLLQIMNAHESSWPDDFRNKQCAKLAQAYAMAGAGLIH